MHWHPSIGRALRSGFTLCLALAALATPAVVRAGDDDAPLNGSGNESVGSVEPSGMTMSGLICDSTDLGLTTITLTVPDEVAKRNLAIFR